MLNVIQCLKIITSCVLSSPLIVYDGKLSLVLVISSWLESKVIFLINFKTRNIYFVIEMDRI